MSIQSVPVQMNQGLDLVTPPLLAEPGALIDCLNYEMTAHSGYRRVDGYERYDGWVDGGVSSYYTTELLADVPSDQSKIVVGSLLGNLSALGEKPVYYGVVVAVKGSSVSYVPFRRTDTINSGQRVFLLADGVSYFFTSTTGSTSGKLTAGSAEEFTTNLRTYSQLLRSLVEEDSSEVAGITWSRDRLYKVLNTTYASWATSATKPAVGTRFSYNGRVWFVTKVEGDTVHFYPDGGLSTNDPSVWMGIDPTGANTTAYTPPESAPTSYDSMYGYMVYANNPDVSKDRGNTVVLSSIRVVVADGKWADKFGPLPGTKVWLSNGTGKIEAVLEHWVQTTSDGDWTAGTRQVAIHLSYVKTISGSSMVPAADWSLYSDEAATGANKVGTIVGDPEMPVLAGTGALRAKSTHYQWGTYNFYAREDMYELYGANGCYRAFWVNPRSWGNIHTQDDSELDDPKYLSMHARSSLALGFADGSVQLSSPGQPYNFNGVEGASEFATGDRVTGLLEAAGESTLVFGKRSISRIVGTSTQNYAMATIVPNAGAFDYSAVNVGSQPVFCDPAGISTLEQSSVYGDFTGQRSTYKISTWLYPKLVPSQDSVEVGGVACAIPVREKMQYRLFLKSGEVVSLCLSAEGPKITFSNYAIQSVPDATTIRVPFAWSSCVSDSGKEMLHVVWDRAMSEQGYDGTVGSIPSGKSTYRMDYGWGFDGEMMRHYYVLAHSFLDNGTVNGTITQIRFYGQGYGVASLRMYSSSVEDDFDMDWDVNGPDVSLPRKQQFFYDRMRDVTNIADTANWGLGTKFKIEGSIPEGSPITEPAYTAQLVVLYIDSQGAIDG